MITKVSKNATIDITRAGNILILAVNTKLTKEYLVSTHTELYEVMNTKIHQFIQSVIYSIKSNMHFYIYIYKKLVKLCLYESSTYKFMAAEVMAHN